MRSMKPLLAALGLLLAGPTLADQGFTVVAHPGVPVDALTRTQLSDLFLKHAVTWPGGAKVEVVEPSEASPVYEAFCNAVHGKSGTLIKAYWKRLTFAGRETAPVRRASDDEVLAYVRATPGAIGYVAPAAAPAGVKVVKVSQ
jgi:ABC-type phosphate transport system substrate-binding protein